MGVIARRRIKEDLHKVEVFINDTANEYFAIQDIPDTFVQGRSTFKIFGSQFLKQGVPLKIEILDRTGKTVYLQPIKYGHGSTPQLQFTYISVEVYNHNAAGEAQLTILGSLDESRVPFDIPENFKGAYNVKLQRTINLDISSIKNTQPILFYKNPNVTATEVVKAEKKADPPPNAFLYGKQIFGKVKDDLRGVMFGTGSDTNNQTGESSEGNDATDKSEKSNADILAELNLWKYKTGEYGTNKILAKKGIKEDRVNSEPPQMTLYSNEPGSFITKMVGTDINVRNIQLDDAQKQNLSGLSPNDPNFPIGQEQINKLFSQDGAAESIPDFKAKVESVISDTELTVTKPYSVDFRTLGTNYLGPKSKLYSDIGKQYYSAPNDANSGLYANFTASYVDWAVPTTSSFRFFSYVDMKISNMRTFSGDVYRMKVYGASDGNQGDFPVLLDTIVEAPQLLVDTGSASGVKRTGYFQNQGHIDKYWNSYGGDGTDAKLNPAYTMSLADGVFLSGSYSEHNESGRFENKGLYNFTIKKDIPYTISFKAIGEKTTKNNINGDSYKDAKLYIHLSGSHLSNDSKLTIPISASFGHPITDELDRGVGLQVDSGSNTPDKQIFDRVSYTFTPKFKLDRVKNEDTVLQFRVDSGNWWISEVSLRAATDTGFSPDEMEIRVPIPWPCKRPDNFDFLIEYYDVDNTMAEPYTFLNNIQISGSELVMEGTDNLLTGSLFIGNVQGSGIEMAGANSAYMRSIGYEGFISASSGEPGAELSDGDNTGYGGFMIWSGSVLPDSPDGYDGAGLEIHDGTYGDDESYFRFRTNPSLFDVKTSRFFLGNKSQFISGSNGNLVMSSSRFFLGGVNSFVSGANGNIEITSSNFHLQPDGDVVMQGTITAEAGGTIGGFDIGASSLYTGNEETPNFFISGSAGGGLGMGKSNLFVSSSGFQVNAQGRISASAGVIGGFSIGKNTISSSNLIINAADGDLRTRTFEPGFRGWRISAGVYGGLDSNGTAEFENVRVRGTFRTAVFEKETVNAVGGQLLICNSTALSGSASATDTTLFCDNVSGFAQNEIIFAKKVTGGGFTKEYMKVTSQSRVSASSGDDMTGYLHVERGFGGDPTASAFTTSSMLKADITTNQTSFNIFTADGGAAEANNTAATASASSLFHRTIMIEDEIMRVSASSATDGKIYVYRGVDGSQKTTHDSGSQIMMVDPNVAFLLGLVSPKESYTEGQVLVSTGRYITGSDGLTPSGGLSTVPAQGSGWIHMNASPTLAQTPYIDLFERTGSDIYDAKMKLRLGDLSGLHGTRLGNEVAIDRESGFGLASENVYLSGLIKANSGSIGGIIMEDNKLFTGTGTHGNDNTGFFIDSASNFSLGNRFVWDGENKTLSVTGSAVTFETPKFFFGESGNSISGSNGNILISGSSVQIQTPKFYLGESTNYISGSNGNLSIASETFNLDATTLAMDSTKRIIMVGDADGQRIVISGSSGELAFFNSDNDQRMRLLTRAEQTSYVAANGSATIGSEKAAIQDMTAGRLSINGSIAAQWHDTWTTSSLEGGKLYMNARQDASLAYSATSQKLAQFHISGSIVSLSGGTTTAISASAINSGFGNASGLQIGPVKASLGCYGVLLKGIRNLGTGAGVGLYITDVTGSSSLTALKGGAQAIHITNSGGAIYNSTGSAREPAYSFSSDRESGFFLESTDDIGVSLNSVEEFRFANGGHFHADNDITAYSSTVASDIRLKENIKPLENNLDKILELKPSSFTWKVRDKQDDVGLIAQEVESVIPMIVKETISIGKTKKFLDGDTHKTVDYSKLTTYLIGAIQEQQKQIDELKKKLEEL